LFLFCLFQVSLSTFFGKFDFLKPTAVQQEEKREREEREREGEREEEREES